MLGTTGFVTREILEIVDLVKTYYVKHIKRYDQIKNKLKVVIAQPVRHVSALSERDRVYDQNIILSMKLLSDEVEEGEIREEDQ